LESSPTSGWHGARRGALRQHRPGRRAAGRRRGRRRRQRPRLRGSGRPRLPDGRRRRAARVDPRPPPRRVPALVPAW